jgi:peptidoglycan/LPS O-acetylase OafA/YrhL
VAIYLAVMADAIAASSAMLVVSFLSVVVAALVQTPRSKGWLLALGVALGDASFSIYLTHSFLLGPTSWIWGRLGLPNELAFLYVGAAVIGSSLLGWATYRIVEQPFMKAVRPLLKAGRRESIRAA